MPTTAAGPLFAPPAAAQRYALVASLAVAAGAKTLVDLGCGDGKLIQVRVQRPAVLFNVYHRATSLANGCAQCRKHGSSHGLENRLSHALGIRKLELTEHNAWLTSFSCFALPLRCAHAACYAQNIPQTPYNTHCVSLAKDCTLPVVQHLASDNALSAAALDRVTGVDISATALVRGRKTLEVPRQATLDMWQRQKPQDHVPNRLE